MWMPRRLRHALAPPGADADQRLASARAAKVHAAEAVRKSAPVAARSAELIDANSIAAAIVASLRPPPRTGGNSHAP